MPPGFSGIVVTYMGVLQWVAMDSFKFHPRSALPYLFTAVSGVAHLQGAQPAAVFYLFGLPTPYASDTKALLFLYFAFLLLEPRIFLFFSKPI
jgi:hypothetical protein